jgi:NADPH2:quinone reductase
MILYGLSSGPVAPIDPGILGAKGSLSLRRAGFPHYSRTREERLSRAADLFRWVQQGELKVRIGAAFQLHDAAAAHKALEGRQTSGKIILLPE